MWAKNSQAALFVLSGDVSGWLSMVFWRICGVLWFCTHVWFLRSTFSESLTLQHEAIVYISKENNDIIIARTNKTSINKSVLVFKHYNCESGFHNCESGTITIKPGFNSILIGIWMCSVLEMYWLVGLPWTVIVTRSEQGSLPTTRRLWQTELQI